MSEERPFEQRPAARPLTPEPLPGTAAPLDPTLPPKKGMGCFGIGCIGVIVVIALAIFIPVIGSAINSTQSSGGGTSTSGGTSGSSSSSGGSTDPIEQARAVLGGAYSYDAVKQTTDAALSATGTLISSENYSRAWSSVLAVTKNLAGVAPMDVMDCVAEVGPSSGMNFPDTAAICATTIHLDG